MEDLAIMPRIAGLGEVVSSIRAQTGQSQSGKPVKAGTVTQAARAAGITRQRNSMKR